MDMRTERRERVGMKEWKEGEGEDKSSEKK